MDTCKLDKMAEELFENIDTVKDIFKTKIVIVPFLKMESYLLILKNANLISIKEYINKDLTSLFSFDCSYEHYTFATTDTGARPKILKKSFPVNVMMVNE